MRSGWIERIPENIAVAIDTLRLSKARSALTILGVVIGVSTVMTYAAMLGWILQKMRLRTGRSNVTFFNDPTGYMPRLKAFPS